MKRKAPAATIENDGNDIFVTFNGVKIARRGYPGTAQARTWVSLEPDCTVRDSEDGSGIVIEHNGVRVQ